MDTLKKWDFFIAHAGADTALAEQLYDLLAGSATVFLDSRSIELGDNWDHALVTAQRQSSITVVLVTKNSDPAYYQRVEVAQAISLARNSPDDHRVIPLYSEEASANPVSEEYGLILKHGVFLSGGTTLETAAFRLLGTLKRLHYKTVLFNSRDGAASHFRAYPNSFWTGKGAESERSSPIGEGTLTIKAGGVLVIERSSAEGRIELQLYEHESLGPKSARKLFPASEKALESRRLWIHCEARTDGSKHGLRFVLKNDPTESWLASEKRVIDSKEWTELDIYFRVDPKLNFWFRIDNEEVSGVPSELSLRNIVLRERA